MFQDTFDRAVAQENDLNVGLPTGQSGALAPLNWNERDAAIAPNGPPEALSNIENNMLHLADGPNASTIHVDHNFTDVAITSAGGMTITLDIVSNDAGVTDIDRYVGFGVGATQTEAENARLDFDADADGGQGWRGRANIATDGFADFGVFWTPGAGTPCSSDQQAGALQIFRNGALIETLDNGGACFFTGQTLELRLQFADFNQDTPVSAEVHWNGAPVKSYRFNWDNDDCGYIGIVSRQAPAGFTVDNFTVLAGATIVNPPTQSTWTGDGADSNWGTAANWVAGVPDFAMGDAELFFPLSSDATPYNEATGRTIAALAFDPGAQAYTIDGEDFTVTDNVTNNSTEAQTIDAGVIVDGATLSAAANTLSLANVEVPTLGILAASGPFEDRKILNIDALTGSGDVSLNGGGIVTLTGDNSTYNGTITLPREDDCAIQISHPNALGSPAAPTFLGGGAYHWLALEGDISVAEALEAQPKGADLDITLSVVNLSGDNTLTGPITMVRDDDAEGRTGLGFRVDDGSLTIQSTIGSTIDGFDLEGDPVTAPLRIVGFGDSNPDEVGETLILAGNVIDDDIDAFSVEARAGITLQINGPANTYTGPTQVFNTSVIELNGDISSSMAIILNNELSVLDATGVGGLTLASGQELQGIGTVLGGVTASGGSHISPGFSTGTLNIEGGLTFQTGAQIDAEVGDLATDLIDVLSGQVTGSGPVTINVSPSVPITGGTFTVLRAPAGITLNAADFVLAEDDPNSLIDSASIIVTATEVQVNVTGSAPITKVLASNASGTNLQLFKVQNGIWSAPTTFLGNGFAGGFNPFIPMWDDTTKELFIIENRGEGDPRPSRVMRLSASGVLLEVLGESNVTPGFTGPPFFGTMAPNGDLVFSTQTLDTTTPAHVIAYRRSGASAGSFVEVASNGLLIADAVDPIELRGVAVTPDNKLFVNDRNNDNQAIMEFDFLTGAFTGIFDGDNLVSAQGITWDGAGDRLLQARDVPYADGVEEYTNDATLPNTSFTPPPFPLYLNGEVEDEINMGIHNFITIDGRLYAARFQQGDIVEFNPGGQFDTTRVAATGLTNPSFLVVADVVECGQFDLDLDDDVDIDDADIFVPCMSGPGNTTVPATCTQEDFTKADSDGDGDVDLADFSAFTLAFGCGQ